jgi:preprotein translocase subunit SecA
VRDILTLALPLWEWAKEDAISAAEIRDRITRAADRWRADKDEKFGAGPIRHMQSSSYCMRWTTSGASTF